MDRGGEKTKPIQSQNKANLKQNEGFFVYDPRDCHGPSDLAMTSISLLHCALVPLWLWHNLKKQSQFPKGQNDVKSIYTMEYGNLIGPRRRENKPNSVRPLDAGVELPD